VTAEAEPADVQSPLLRFDAQHQYVGALLSQGADTAAQLLAVVPDDAITDPLTRWTHELIRSLVAAGRDPHPVCVLHRARTQPAVQALNPNAAPTPRELHRLTLHLVALHTNAVVPLAVFECARDVLDDAYRTAYHRGGARMQQLAEARADTRELGAELVAICTRLVELRRRATACAAARSARPPR
jgi:hypothetical protein